MVSLVARGSTQNSLPSGRPAPSSSARPAHVHVPGAHVHQPFHLGRLVGGAEVDDAAGSCRPAPRGPGRSQHRLGAAPGPMMTSSGRLVEHLVVEHLGPPPGQPPGVGRATTTARHRLPTAFLPSGKDADLADSVTPSSPVSGLTERRCGKRGAARLQPGRPAPGTASRRRSPGRPRGRSGSSPGRRRARRTLRSAAPGRAARPSSTAMRTSRPTPSRSIDSNGDTPKMPSSRYREKNDASTSSRENPQPIWVRSLVPNEKNSAASAICAGGQRRPRHLDHRADRGGHRRSHRAAAPRQHVGLGTHRLQLLHGADERHHDLRPRVAAGRGERWRPPRRSPAPASRTAPA